MQVRRGCPEARLAPWGLPLPPGASEAERGPGVKGLKRQLEGGARAGVPQQQVPGFPLLRPKRTGPTSPVDLTAQGRPAGGLAHSDLKPPPGRV